MKKSRATASFCAPSAPPAPAVASYDATVSVTVIRSSFRASAALTQSSRNKLREAPGYAAWPPATFMERGIELSQVDDQTLALARLKLVFDFGAGISAESSEELSRAIDRRWPKLATARTALMEGTGSVAYAQSAVTAEVNANGEPSWGYTGNVNGGQPLPLAGEAAEGQRTEFDAFLQNLMRLDLQQRIEKRLA